MISFQIVLLRSEVIGLVVWERRDKVLEVAHELLGELKSHNAEFRSCCEDGGASPCHSEHVAAELSGCMFRLPGVVT